MLMPRRVERFFRVPRRPHATSAGPVDLPILYQDASCVIAVFRASAEGAERLLANTGLVPQVGLPGAAAVAVAVLAFYEYRETSIGAYNEVGTAILTRPRGSHPSRSALADLFAPARWRTTGFFVVDLPVTSRLADAAGRDIWGYPKFVTDIEFQLAGREVRSTVFEPAPLPEKRKASIVSLRGRAGPGVPVPSPDLVTYTTLGSRPLRTKVDVRGAMMLRSPGSVTLEVGPSGHRMAENLRTLGIPGSPLFLLETEHFQSRLPAGSLRQQTT